MAGERQPRMDPAGFFVIHVDDSRGNIVIEHYSYQRELLNKLTGESAKDLNNALIERELVTDLRHAAYLGRELMKAELALKNRWKYKQDNELTV